MSEWLRQRHMVVERALSVARRQRGVDTLRRTRDVHHGALRHALATLNCPHPAEVTLSRLLSVAQTTIAAAQTEQAEQLELRRELQAVEATAARQSEKAEECRDGLKRWTKVWAAMATAIGWPDDVDPDDARQLLWAIDELARHLRDVTQLNTRVGGIRDRIETFNSDATALVAEAAADLASWPVLDAVAELGRRLDKAIERRSQQETLESELEVAHEELEAAERTVEKAERDLAELTAIAGVPTVEELPAVEQRADRLQLLSSRLPEIERQIAEAGQAALGDIIQRADGVELDVLDAEVDAADAEATQLEEQLAQLDMQMGELGSERHAMERTGGAADAGQIVEQHRAELRELVDRYLRVQIAALGTRRSDRPLPPRAQGSAPTTRRRTLPAADVWLVQGPRGRLR